MTLTNRENNPPHKAANVIGAYLLRCRQQAGHSIRHVAKAAGVGHGTLSKAENGLTKIGKQRHPALAQVLGCSAASLDLARYLSEPMPFNLQGMAPVGRNFVVIQLGMVYDKSWTQADVDAVMTAIDPGHTNRRMRPANPESLVPPPHYDRRLAFEFALEQAGEFIEQHDEDPECREMSAKAQAALLWGIDTGTQDLVLAAFRAGQTFKAVAIDKNGAN